MNSALESIMSYLAELQFFNWVDHEQTKARVSIFCRDTIRLMGYLYLIDGALYFHPAAPTGITDRSKELGLTPPYTAFHLCDPDCLEKLVKHLEEYEAWYLQFSIV